MFLLHPGGDCPPYRAISASEGLLGLGEIGSGATGSLPPDRLGPRHGDINVLLAQHVSPWDV